MSDRELLERAAKAARLYDYTEWADKIRDHDSPHYGQPALHKAGIGGQADSWNPLIDDGDALRLANDMFFSIIHTSCADDAPVVLVGDYIEVESLEEHAAFPDVHAEVRRAIVQAAAGHYERLESYGLLVARQKR